MDTASLVKMLKPAIIMVLPSIIMDAQAKDCDLIKFDLKNDKILMGCKCRGGAYDKEIPIDSYDELLKNPMFDIQSIKTALSVWLIDYKETTTDVFIESEVLGDMKFTYNNTDIWDQTKK